MSKDIVKYKVPTLAELTSDQPFKDNALMVILNQEPPKDWVKNHPTAKLEVVVNGVKEKVPVKYIPRERIEYLLSRIFVNWWVEIIHPPALLGNSIAMTVRLYVTDPLTGTTRWNDGVGASPLQTDSGAGAIEFNKLKSYGVMTAAPSAETYAFKDAAEKFGKIFGKDLNVKEQLDYNPLLKQPPVTIEELQDLFTKVKGALSEQHLKDAERIIGYQETASYNKLHKVLTQTLEGMQ